MKNSRGLVKKVRAFAKAVYPKHNFENHILPATQIAVELAEKLEADVTVVEAATYLHDIGRVLFLYRYHEKTGSCISRLILPLLGFDKEHVDAISYCVLVHDARETDNFQTKEAEIVANADAISQFENFLYMFSIHWCTHGRDTRKTKMWLKEKYERAWQAKITLDVARSQIGPKYEIVKRILDES